MSDAKGAPTLAWNIPNLISVTLMVLITFALGGFVIRAARAFVTRNQGGDASEAAA